MIYQQETFIDCKHQSPLFSEIEIQELFKKKECSLVFKIYLPEHMGSLFTFEATLDLRELDRANRYFHLKDRSRFIICRSWIKIVLATALGVGLNEIQLDYDANKKPILKFNSDVFFNVSHSGDYAILGLSKIPIGVDIEQIKHDFPIKELIAQVFSQAEAKSILEAENQSLNFFKLWTRKEALVKASGKGIDENIKRIPCLDGSHTSTLESLLKIAKWQVFNFKITEDYVGAVALAVGEKCVSSQFYQCELPRCTS